MTPDEIATKSDIQTILDRLDRLQSMIEGATIHPASEWVTYEKAARLLGCSTQTVRNKVRTGEIRANGMTGKARRIHITPEMGKR